MALLALAHLSRRAAVEFWVSG